MTNRIELCGRLTDRPELRTTPSGAPLLRMTVECGQGGEELRLAVAMIGTEARQVAGRLKSRQTVRVLGRLREVHVRLGSGLARTGIEVVASEIVPADEAP
jgi:single-stranded DNA-binding protein